ncbi:alpha/beta hydrolase [Kitasatospora sp. MMS16-BH015]|uniref:alpha/beta hydrolase n=1 Tax=Kitasatospora sp. MMS16-BH015 TaxID=2018025 RepID=UPI000CA13C29|nr:alpha/beta hydrolase [Kitasatospora sp. MMS16-BH015]AUG78820.1 alpha/beta hydrolase [Kitasatospora sp. MMS16-BH015]
MYDLDELKGYARLHARGQGVDARRVAEVLDGITNDTPGDEHSWARVWHTAAYALAARGRELEACAHYAMARFPYPSDQPRAEAQQAAVAAFDRWRTAHGGIEPLEVAVPGKGKVRAWTAGLDAADPRPLIVVMGGIVSTKEQWAPQLPKFAKQGFAAVVAEFPGVGENGMTYTADSWRLLPALLDALQGRARLTDVSLLTLSFSGHLALRAAATDDRIGRVLTVGAPVSAFFTDDQWWETSVPAITKQTLAHLTGLTDPAALRAELRGWALTEAELDAVQVPVGYVVSTRDEIIPRADGKLLADRLPQARFKEFDDVHGSPDHLGEMRLWLMHALLSSQGIEDHRTAALEVGLGLHKLAEIVKEGRS